MQQESRPSGINQISKAITQIDDSNQKNAESADQSTQAASDVFNQIVQLRESIDEIQAMVV